MQDLEPKQQINELLNGYRSVDYSFPGRAVKALDGVSEDLRERARVAGDLTEEVEAIRQEREAEVYNRCQGNRKLELTALKEIRTFAVQARSIIEEIILLRDGSRDFARAGEDVYERSGAYRRLKEQIGHRQRSKSLEIRRIQHEHDASQEALIDAEMRSLREEIRSLKDEETPRNQETFEHSPDYRVVWHREVRFRLSRWQDAFRGNSNAEKAMLISDRGTVRLNI